MGFPPPKGPVRVLVVDDRNLLRVGLRRIPDQDPDVRVIVISVSCPEPYLSTVLEAGAHGLLSKDGAADEVPRAVHAVLEDRLDLSPDVAYHYVGGRRPHREAPPA